MNDRVRCARCDSELWWWKAYWWRGDPDTPYCSRRCAQPQYAGRVPPDSDQTDGEA